MYTYFYKYEPDNTYKLKALRKKKIWLSSSDNFNDPFDCNIIHYNREMGFIGPEIKKKVLQEIYSEFDTSRSKFINDKLLEEIKEFYNSSFLRDDEINIAINERYKQLGVCSFSSSSFSNQLMWAHYANNHKGYCIEFKKKISIIINPSDVHVRSIYLVSYISSLPEQDIFSFLINPDQIAERMALIKHIDWSYEKEFRLLDFENANKLINIDEVGLEISAIYIGLNSTPCVVSQLYNIANSLGVNIYKMNIEDGIFDYN